GQPPVAAATVMLIILATLPRPSQYSAPSGVTVSSRMFGSSLASHHAFAATENNSLMRSRSLLIAPRPDTATLLFDLVVSVPARHEMSTVALRFCPRSGSSPVARALANS